MSLPLPDKPSIAVLPFTNMSGDPEQEYFADGMVEDIITALSRIRWLFVIARNSSFTYKGQAVDVKQAGRELGVRYVLEGSVRKGGNRIRIAGQLIDAITGAHLWAERYDRDLSDIFTVQDEIAASVTAVIEPALAAAEQERVLRKPPERLDAWEAYQRGLWHFHKYRPEENKTALAFFSQAIALDPNFAPGHYGYALALQWNIWHFSSRPFLEVQGTAREEAQIAVSLDDKDAMAHAVLAHMMMWGGEWEAAIRRSAHRGCPQSKQCLCHQHAWLCTRVRRLSRGSTREVAAGNACQPTRSPDLALVALARGLAVFFTRFRRCAADIAPSCSPASELCYPLRIRRRVARLSRAIGRGARSTGTCSPAIGGAASALAAKAALDAARGLCATGRRCPPCGRRAGLSATPRSQSSLNDFQTAR